jgi:hypothetical protein
VKTRRSRRAPRSRRSAIPLRRQFRPSKRTLSSAGRPSQRMKSNDFSNLSRSDPPTSLPRKCSPAKSDPAGRPASKLPFQLPVLRQTCYDSRHAERLFDDLDEASSDRPVGRPVDPLVRGFQHRLCLQDGRPGPSSVLLRPRRRGEKRLRQVGETQLLRRSIDRQRAGFEIDEGRAASPAGVSGGRVPGHRSRVRRSLVAVGAMPRLRGERPAGLFEQLYPPPLRGSRA